MALPLDAGEKGEKVVSLLRALVLLCLINSYHSLQLLKTSSPYILDGLFLSASFYCLVTLFLGFLHLNVNLFFSLMDALWIGGICFFTGKFKSPLVELLYLPILNSGLRFGWKGGISQAVLFCGILILGLNGGTFSHPAALSLRASAAFILSFGVGVLLELSEKKKLKADLEQSNATLQSLQSMVAQLKQQVTQETISDTLTDLHNMKYFLLQVAEEIPKAKRHGYPFSLVMIGVDNFKMYNKNYGEKTGDEALRIISMLLRAYVRNSDMVARYDKTDKFMLILPYTDGEQCKIPMERFREAVYRYRFSERDPNVHLSVSCGVAVFPADSENENVLFEKAEAALRRVKVRGKNALCVFGEG